MPLARLHPDGSITDIGTGPRGAALWPDEERIELDRMPEGFGPHRIDPQDPRRAIPDPAALANRAAEATLNKAIALESRARDLAALVAKGMPGAAAALVSVEAEQAAVIDAAKA